MTAIDNPIFSFKRLKDSYILTSKLNTILTYTLTLLKCEGELVIADEGVFDPIEEETTTLSLKVLLDGFYSLNVNGTIIYFSNWKGHLENLIPLIKRTLCEDCGCKPVNCLPKEAINCMRNQSLFNFIQTYTYLIKPYSIGAAEVYNPVIFDFLQRNVYDSNCFITSELCKQLLETCISGEAKTNQELFNYFIAIYYLALYYYDITSIDGSILSAEEVEEELVYIDKVYDYKRIKRCIRNLNINIEDMITPDLTNTVVYYWQLDNPTDNINDVTPLITDVYLAAQPNQSYNVFKQGFTCPNIYIGRMVFVVAATPIQNFTLIDGLGNDVTDEFDTAYNNVLSAAIFVSKDYYPNSNIFFKFKTIFDV